MTETQTMTQPETETQTATYIIPEGNLEPLTEQIEKLNKRARKLKVAEIQMSFSVDHVQVEWKWFGERKNVWMTESEWEEKKTEWTVSHLGSLTGRKKIMYAVTITGTAPKFADWKFVGTLEPVYLEDSSENLLRVIPGEQVPERYRTQVNVCEHCQTTRRRKETFVVQNTVTGAYKAIGRSCLKDFLGHKDPHNLASWAEVVSLVGRLCVDAQDEEWGGSFGSSGPRTYDLRHYLTHVAVIIEKDGWLSRSAARDWQRPSTADMAGSLVEPPYHVTKDYLQWKAERQPNETHEQLANEAIEWVKSLDVVSIGDDTYLQNINLIGRAGYVTWKMMGFAASILPAYSRAKEEEVKRQLLAKRPESHHVGTLGKRMEMTVTCETIISSEGYYGLTGIHRMHDQEGNDVIWFASGSAEWLKPGRVYRVKATPKKHDAYNGRPQTTVSRLTILEDITPEETSPAKVSEGN